MFSPTFPAPDRMRATARSEGEPVLDAVRSLPDDPLTQRTRTIWTSGDFARIAEGFAPGAADFVTRLQLTPGEEVLDAACGTGNLALPAAAFGARVTGLDIAANLLETARRDAAARGLPITFHEGTVEALPYGDGRFQTVMSMFGVMFAARPGETVAELLRVTRSGGRIVLANWTPTGFIGQLLRAHTSLVPPPPGVPSVLGWGDPAVLQERLAVHAQRVQSITCIPRLIDMTFALTPAGVVELFREFYGPSVRTFGALNAAGRATLFENSRALWAGHNLAGDGMTQVKAEYLEVTIGVA